MAPVRRRSAPSGVTLTAASTELRRSPRTPRTLPSPPAHPGLASHFTPSKRIIGTLNAPRPAKHNVSSITVVQQQAAPKPNNPQKAERKLSKTASLSSAPSGPEGGIAQASPQVASASEPQAVSTSPKRKSTKRSATLEAEQPPLPLLDAAAVRLNTTLPRPPLPFSLKEARTHLESADPRFRVLFRDVPLSTYAEAVEANESGTSAEPGLDLFKSVRVDHYT